MDINVVRPHQPLIAERHHLDLALAGIVADDVREDAQPELAGEQPLVLVDGAAERERHELVVRGEMLLLQALDVGRLFRAGTGAARIGVERADA